MNIFLRAGDEQIFAVPFRFEQLIEENSACMCKLVLNTEQIDLPFHQIIFTLLYVDEFEQMINVDEHLYKQQFMIDLDNLKLCVNTFCRCEYLSSQFFEIMESEYVHVGVHC